ncbi:unnamed protein product [Brassicogethes aeneus]|uniref:Cytosol aminopeptidase domain-containing protein n=1 Tax=Brassicogethes aeneus TaxID=1431903 RepID=A0A9P0FI57_BRAAE|nr:unnamed protein product [Brassicogethes aeneus]
MTENGPPETRVIAENNLESDNYDGVILVSHPGQEIQTEKLKTAVETALKYDPSLKTEIVILPLSYPAGRLVHVPTGPLDPDYDDVRVFKECARKGIKRALKAGMRRPLLVLEDNSTFINADLVTLLGALEALYTPIQVREHNPCLKQKVTHLGVYTKDPKKTESLVNMANVLEAGRRVACDIGDADPERMSPPNVEAYLTSVFKDTCVSMNVVKDLNEIEKDYPLFEAVNRAAKQQERHQGRIVFLEYNPAGPGPVKETVYLVGKGVTYDTGGADIKVGGSMLGMSRDKCGAAAVAGFMCTVAKLQPQDVKFVAGLSLVRNSVGSNSYVADEVITARSGARVRIINTDAEGRMVMADVLCKFKEAALDAVNPHLFTVATLTGHAVRTVGDGYSIIIDNGPARKEGNAQKMQIASDLIGDPIEISTLRREDISNHKGQAEGDDVVQGQAKPSTMSNRGHQGPMAFLLMASGLDKHGSGSEKPLKYSHLDIAASAGDCPNPATGAPILALAKNYLFVK